MVPILLGGKLCSRFIFDPASEGRLLSLEFARLVSVVGDGTIGLVSLELVQYECDEEHAEDQRYGVDISYRHGGELA